MAEKRDLELEILKLLRLYDEVGHIDRIKGVPDLDRLVKHFGLPMLEVRRVCNALEAKRFIKGTHSTGGDKNPTYEITESGTLHLYTIEKKNT